MQKSFKIKLRVILLSLLAILLDLCFLSLLASQKGAEEPIIISMTPEERLQEELALKEKSEGVSAMQGDSESLASKVIATDTYYTNAGAKVMYQVPNGYSLSEDYKATLDHSLLVTDVPKTLPLASYTSNKGTLKTKIIPFVYNIDTMDTLNENGVVLLDDGIIDYVVSKVTEGINADLSGIVVREEKIVNLISIRVEFTFEENRHIIYCVPFKYNFFEIEGVNSAKEAGDNIESSIIELLGSLTVAM